MAISERLYHALKARAAHTAVETVSIGLGYTAVATEDGGLGLACTMLDSVKSCHIAGDLPGFEGGPADALLEYLLSDAPIRRTLALALANALNHAAALSLPEDRHNTVLFSRLGIGPGSKVAMVGHFGPLIKKLAELKAEVEMVDKGRGEGDETALLKKIETWADALIMTSTTLINGTAEAFLSAVGPGVKVAMIGPSTPLVAEAFDGLPVHLLGGTVPVDSARTFAAIRHGRGTPVLQRYAQKSFLDLSGSAA
ncbi:MAG: DUF364 domain-containing protein [Desulfobacterales bacterium]|nr:DUF364 domain-containing protein [Desulfobacterales bacterium]